MNEFQASLGILQLKYHSENIRKRAQIAKIYRSELGKIEGISMLPEHPDVSNYNYSYMPIFVTSQKYGKTRDELYYFLKENEIYGRRYFYPLISQFPPYKNLPSSAPENLKVAKEVSKKVICLPIYPELEEVSVRRIINLIK